MNINKFSKYFKYLFFILFQFACLFGQKSESSEEKFVHALLSGDENIESYIDKNELKISKRLGIEYDNVPNKYLLTYDIDKKIKTKINSNQLTYVLESNTLEDDFSKIIFRALGQNYYKEFYFKDGKYISPIYYFTRNWSEKKSKYFHFFAADRALINPYSMTQMDMFFENIAELLDLSDKEKKRVKKQKIYYYLCKDQDEIQYLTGYKARGLYVLAHDYLVSTFNTHTHEAAHLIMNFKLRNVPLYTHPFLQEGFAVATGGRGGKDKQVILNLGEFLCQIEFLMPESILSGKEFYQNSASMTYPVSGLYSAFLLQSFEVEDYLKLYLKYSSSDPDIRQSVIDKRDLPENSKWEKFLENISLSSIEFESSQDASLIYDQGSYSIYQDQDYYYFRAKDTLLIGSDKSKSSYRSKLFEQFFPNQTYGGEKYLILVNKEEIGVYNLYTNNLLDKFIRSFTIDGRMLPYKNGRFTFQIKKDVFDGNIFGEE